MRVLSGGVLHLDQVEKHLMSDPRLIEELAGLWRCDLNDAAPSTSFHPVAADYDAV